MDRLAQFHQRVAHEDGYYVYPPKPGCEEESKRVWRWTGVCPECHRRAITTGRCIMCGWESDPKPTRRVCRWTDCKAEPLAHRDHCFEHTRCHFHSCKLEQVRGPYCVEHSSCDVKGCSEEREPLTGFCDAHTRKWNRVVERRKILFRRQGS